MKPEVTQLYFVCEGYDHKPVDVALTLELAQKRALEHLGRTDHPGIVWSVTIGGHLAAYRDDVWLIAIEKHQIEPLQIVLREKREIVDDGLINLPSVTTTKSATD